MCLILYLKMLLDYQFLSKAGHGFSTILRQEKKEIKKFIRGN